MNEWKLLQVRMVNLNGSNYHVWKGKMEDLLYVKDYYLPAVLVLRNLRTKQMQNELFCIDRYGFKFEDEIQGLSSCTLPDTWETFRTSLFQLLCTKIQKKENKKKNYYNQKNKHKKDDDVMDSTKRMKRTLVRESDGFASHAVCLLLLGCLERKDVSYHSFTKSLDEHLRAYGHHLCLLEGSTRDHHPSSRYSVNDVFYSLMGESPECYAKAMEDEHKKEWFDAMQDEMKSLYTEQYRQLVVKGSVKERANGCKTAFFIGDLDKEIYNEHMKNMEELPNWKQDFEQILAIKTWGPAKTNPCNFDFSAIKAKKIAYFTMSNPLKKVLRSWIPANPGGAVSCNARLQKGVPCLQQSEYVAATEAAKNIVVDYSYDDNAFRYVDEAIAREKLKIVAIVIRRGEHHPSETVNGEIFVFS
ncbi:hypothetical protein Tco_0507911 [Tanacetum coccineum]